MKIKGVVFNFLSSFILGFCFLWTSLTAESRKLPLMIESEMAALEVPVLDGLRGEYQFLCQNTSAILEAPLDSRIVLGLAFRFLHTCAMNSLRECSCLQFSRDECPYFRNGLVKFLIQEVLAKYPDKRRPLTYVSVGSGKLFLDVILVTMLLRCGYKNIHVFLLDRVYSGHFDPERRPTEIVQFVQWMSFVARNEHARMAIIMGDDIKEFRDAHADVVVAADLDLRIKEELEDAILECLRMLKDGGVYGFMVDKSLTHLVGQPLIQQNMKVYSQDMFPELLDILNLGLYVGAKGVQSTAAPIRYPDRESTLIGCFGVLVPRMVFLCHEIDQ